MRKKAKIDFFRVHLSDPNNPLESVMDKVASLPNVKAQNIYWSGCPMRLLRLDASRDERDGAMVKIRMTDLPKKSDTEGNSAELDLDDNEGLGEETAFVYHIPSRVLVLLRNRNSVSPGAFVHYFASYGAGEFTLEHIIREDALKRFLEKGLYRKLELKLAGLDMAVEELATDDFTANEAIAISRQLQSPSIEIIASMDRKTGSLSAEMIHSVVSALRGLWGKHPEMVERIRVSGQDDEEAKTEIIDLLEFALREEVDITVGGDARSIPTGHLLSAVNEAWNRQRDYIRTIYPWP